MNRKEDLYAIDLTGASWRKSPASNTNDHCVEITGLPGGGMAVRDSKNPDRPDLRYTADEWAAFRSGIVNGTL
ncbi:DUF397 domain-containing protein [Streptomyces sp. NPDC002537]